MTIYRLLWRVLTTETLCCSGWCDEKSRYLFVCVGFLYTDMLISPLSQCRSRTSRYGKTPSDSISWVNCMLGLMLLRWLRNLCFINMKGCQGIIHVPLPKLGGGSKVESARSSISSNDQIGNRDQYRGAHCRFKNITLISGVQAQVQKDNNVMNSKIRSIR